MDAPRQKLMNDNATVVATTTLAVVVVGLLTSDAISGTNSPAPVYLGHVSILRCSHGSKHGHPDCSQFTGARFSSVAGGRLRARPAARAGTEGLRYRNRRAAGSALGYLSEGSTRGSAVRSSAGGRSGSSDVPERPFLRGWPPSIGGDL